MDVEESSSVTDSARDSKMPVQPIRGVLGKCSCWKTSSGPPPRWLVYLAAVTLNAAFGFYPVLIKLVAFNNKPDSNARQANPFIFTLYRCLGATVVLLTGSHFVEGSLKLPSLKMWLVFLLFGIVGIFGAQFSYIAGLSIVPAEIASAFQPLIPVWTSIVTILICTESIPSLNMVHSWAKIIGVLVATGGAIKLALVDYNSAESHAEQSKLRLLGYFGLTLETMLAAVFYSLQKKLIYIPSDCIWKDYPMAVTGYAHLCGVLFESMFCLYFLFSGQAEIFFIPKKSLPALLYAIFITSSFCYGLITWASKYLPSSVLTAFWPLQVVCAATMAYLLLGESLNFIQVLSSCAIIIGLFLVVYSNRVTEQIDQTGSGGIKLDCCCNSQLSKTNSS